MGTVFSAQQSHLIPKGCRIGAVFEISAVCSSPIRVWSVRLLRFKNLIIVCFYRNRRVCMRILFFFRKSKQSAPFCIFRRA